MYGYVYKTTNSLNGRIYIGQKKGAFNPAYFGSGVLIKRSVLEHGTNNFKVEILCFADSKQDLDEKEIDFIKSYRKVFPHNDMYNIASGGEGGNTFKNTEEDRQRMRIIVSKRKKVWNKGLTKQTSPSVARIAESKRGKPAHNRGIPITEEQRLKQRKAMQGRHSSPSTEFKKGS